MSRQYLEVYEDKKDEWRWRFISNKKIMADSAEGYKTKGGAQRAFRSLMNHILFNEDELQIKVIEKPKKKKK